MQLVWHEPWGSAECAASSSKRPLSDSPTLKRVGSHGVVFDYHQQCEPPPSVMRRLNVPQVIAPLMAMTLPHPVLAALRA